MIRRRAVAAVAAGCATAAATFLGAAPAEAAGGACDPGTGVTVVVDYGPLGGGIRIACDADGGGHPAAAVMAATGFDLEYVQTQPGFVCRIDGRPSSLQEKCARTPPQDAYWGLFWSDKTSGSWAYSSIGATGLEVPDGGSIGWRFEDGGAREEPGAKPGVASGSPTPTPSPQPPRGPRHPHPGTGHPTRGPQPTGHQPTGHRPTGSPQPSQTPEPSRTPQPSVVPPATRSAEQAQPPGPTTEGPSSRPRTRTPTSKPSPSATRTGSAPRPRPGGAAARHHADRRPQPSAAQSATPERTRDVGAGVLDDGDPSSGGTTSLTLGAAALLILLGGVVATLAWRRRS